MSRDSLFSYNFEEFQTLIAELGLAKFRAKQVWDWVFKKFVFSFAEMTNLSKKDRELLEQKFPRILPPLKKAVKAKDGTLKIVVELADGNLVEAVALPDEDAMTFCLSSQAGCPIGCVFCRTGENGFKRNLTTEEILLQVMLLIKRTGMKPTNIVFMGMGEPFLNRKALFSAIDALTDPAVLGLATRRITISTAGIIPGIKELIERPGEVNLAISLHSVDEQTRTRLVPINKSYPLARLREAIAAYCEATGRRVTFEIVLLKGINDQQNDAFNLVNFCEGLLCHVNIVRFNKYPGSPFEPSSENDDREFRKILKKAGIAVTVRKSRGQDILAACGQLSGSDNEQEK
ncbi:MAG: 23S rRNA (adenine(2503)-C(2))-methyltransferase RlmN [Candidatus Rifleibacteriota bacterium]